MNPNQTNNSLPPLPGQDQGGNSNALMQPAPQATNEQFVQQSGEFQAANNSVQPMPQVPTSADSSQRGEWNSTPWMLGIFVLLVLIAVLTIIALNVYNRPASGTNTGTSSSATSTVASSDSNAYGITISSLTYSTEAAEWSYEISGNLPTPCHSAVAEVLVMESFPEQVMININLNTPEEDVMCIQVIDEFTLTGTFKASAEATARIGTVRVT